MELFSTLVSRYYYENSIAYETQRFNACIIGILPCLKILSSPMELFSTLVSRYYYENSIAYETQSFNACIIGILPCLKILSSPMELFSTLVSRYYYENSIAYETQRFNACIIGILPCLKILSSPIFLLLSRWNYFPPCFLDISTKNLLLMELKGSTLALSEFYRIMKYCHHLFFTS